jgi:hypothetical protein
MLIHFFGGSRWLCLGEDLLLRRPRTQDATVEAEVAAGLGPERSASMFSGIFMGFWPWDDWDDSSLLHGQKGDKM